MYSDKIYNSWKPIQNEKYKQIVKNIDIRPLLKLPAADIGIGSGIFEEFLQKRGIEIKNIIGVDKNVNMIKKQRVKLKNIIADANSLPFKDNIFGFIICLDTIHLIKNVKEIKRVLKNHGYLLLSTFCNRENKGKKIKKIKQQMKDLDLIKEFTIESKEMEIVFLYRKR